MPRRERGLGLGALAAWLRAVGAAAGRGRAGPAHSAAPPAPGPEGGRRRDARLRRTGFAGNRRCAVPAGVCFDPEHLGSAAGPRVPPGRRGVQRGSPLTWGWDRGAVRGAARAAGAGGTGTAPRAAERGGDAHSVSRFTEHPRTGAAVPRVPLPGKVARRRLLPSPSYSSKGDEKQFREQGRKSVFNQEKQPGRRRGAPLRGASVAAEPRRRPAGGAWPVCRPPWLSFRRLGAGNRDVAASAEDVTSVPPPSPRPLFGAFPAAHTRGAEALWAPRPGRRGPASGKPVVSGS